MHCMCSAGILDMKYGDVVRMRLLPEDSMGCIDVCKAAGVYVEGMSLSQIAKVALSGLLEAYRNAGVIPRRDGYEYTQLVHPITAAGNNARKLQISTIVESAQVSRIGFGKSAVSNNLPPPSNDTLVPKKGRVLVRLIELEQKLDSDPDNVTVEEQDKIQSLRKALQQLESGQDIDIKGLM